MAADARAAGRGSNPLDVYGDVERSLLGQAPRGGEEEAAAAAAAAASQPALGPDAAPPAPKRPRIDLDALEAQAAPPAIVDVDLRTAKKLAVAFEKKLNANLEARMKYMDAPEKFMDSELELDEAVKSLQLLATAPQLFPELVKLRLHVSVLSLLAHENTDVAAGALSLLSELTEDPDDEVGAGVMQGLNALVAALLEGQLLPLLVKCLARFDEGVAEEAEAVFHALSVVEHVLQQGPDAIAAAGKETKLLQWLLARVKRRAMDSTKLSASEVLSMLLQDSEANQKQVGAMNGVDLLLQAVAPFRKKAPDGLEEEETVHNLFNALCTTLLPSENKARFVQAEGIDLMLLIIKQKGFAVANAFKVLDYALADCPAACERFVDVLGLKTVFSALMGKIGKKMKIEDGEKSLQERVVSILASLVTQTPRGARRDRVLAKFVEGEFEKLDRAVELLDEYKAAVAAAERRWAEEQAQYEDAGDEDDDEEEERTSALLDAGLFALQQLCIVVASCVASRDPGLVARVHQLLAMNGYDAAFLVRVLQGAVDLVGTDRGEEEQRRTQGRLRRLIAALQGPSAAPGAAAAAADDDDDDAAAAATTTTADGEPAAPPSADPQEQEQEQQEMDLGD